MLKQIQINKTNVAKQSCISIASTYRMAEIFSVESSDTSQPSGAPRSGIRFSSSYTQNALNVSTGTDTLGARTCCCCCWMVFLAAAAAAASSCLEWISFSSFWWLICLFWMCSACRWTVICLGSSLLACIGEDTMFSYSSILSRYSR